MPVYGVHLVFCPLLATTRGVRRRGGRRAAGRTRAARSRGASMWRRLAACGPPRPTGMRCAGRPQAAIAPRLRPSALGTGPKLTAMVPLGLKLPLGRGMALALVIAHAPSPPWIRPPSGAWHDSGTRETLTPELRGRQQVRVGCVKGLDDIPAHHLGIKAHHPIVILLDSIDERNIKTLVHISSSFRDPRLISALNPFGIRPPAS